MAVPTISYAEARTLVLSRLRDTMTRLPVVEREKPRYIINFRSLSILDLIREVEMDTDLGRRYVYDEARRLGYAIR